MPEADQNGGRFDVLCTAAIAHKIKDLQEQAGAEGRGKQFLEALRDIARRLIYDPHDFGEPLYRLPALRMQICHAVLPPLIVYFGVCEDRPVVFLRGVELLPKQKG